MLDPEKVGGFKIHVARDSRKLFDAVDGQKAKEGGGGEVEYSSNYPVCFYGFDRIGE